MGDGTFERLNGGVFRAESAKRREIGLSGMSKILSIRGRTRGIRPA
jgi:hypothetical protein